MKANERLRLIKDPFYKDLNFITYGVVDELNDYRVKNNLHGELTEDSLRFDEQHYINDYAAKIGAIKPVLKNHKSELWYYADLSVIRYLKKYGYVWDWDIVEDTEYFTNFDELCDLITEDDLINQANELSSNMAERVWQYGGRFLGANFMEVVTVDFDGEVVKFWLDMDCNIQFKPGFEPSDEVLNKLELLKNETA